LEQKTLNVLEFNKILEMLISEATNDLSRKKIQELFPFSDINKIKTLQDELSIVISLLLRKGTPRISGMKDITSALKRAEIGGVLNTTELLNVAEVLKIARNLLSYYDEKSILDCYFDALTDNRKIEEAIFSAIISEEEISDSASVELASIRRQITNTHGKIRESLNSIIHSTKYQKYLQESIVTMRNGRYVVPVKSEHKGDVSGIVHDMSSTGSTLFVEPNVVVNANNHLRELDIKEQAEIERILAELTSKVSEIIHELFVNQRTIADLDFLFAKARLALKMKANTPSINDKGIIRIEKGRHPLLNQQTVVPVTVYLGDEFKTLVITGPNTGGKTVALKTVGLFCLMASSGLAIPAADRTEICILENIFADIGDEQSIEQSLSTFSSHMTNIVHILNKITPNSLVLFDELGAGTDPTEGAALAIAILKHIKEIGALTVATTHYSEIKIYALTTEGVENASCEFDVNSLKPTYKLLIGVPGKSNAFAISKRLGLPEYIIEKANEHLSEENIRFEDVISNLENSRQLAEMDKQTANRYKRDIELLKNELELEKQKIADTKQKLTATAQRESKRIIEDTKKEMEEIIEEIRLAQKEQTHQELNKTLTEAKTKFNTKLKNADNSQITPKKQNNDIPKNLISGSSVFIIDIGQNGTVLDPPKADGNVALQVGIIKITSHISNLRLVKDVQTEKSALNKSRGGGLRLEGIKNEIDLRGNTLEDAIMLTEKYIDDAYLSSLNQVTVIHGKGTGVLRKGVHDMLKRHPNVKSYRLGVYGEGENGVTVVELK